MRNVEEVKQIFLKNNGMMRTGQLTKEKIYYADISYLLEKGFIEKVRTGYYQWVDNQNFSEVVTVTRLFPDGIFCMDTALRHYGYSDRTPIEWHIAVSKHSNKTRFYIDYPFVKPYYVAPDILELGICECIVDEIPVRMYDKERVICDCLRYRNKMDKETFNKAIQGFVSDTSKNIPKLMEYAAKLRCVTLAKNLLGVWL